MKISIINNYPGFNKGNEALLNSILTSLNDKFPDAEFNVYTYDLELNYSIKKDYIRGIKVNFHRELGKIGINKKLIRTFLITVSLLLYRFPGNIKIFNGNGIKEFADSDLVISTGGDVLTEDYGPRSLYSCYLNILYGKLLKKPVVLYAESIGPFHNAINRRMSKIVLNKADLITLREELSEKNLKEIGVNDPIIKVTADSAFLLEPADENRIKEILNIEGPGIHPGPMIGFSVSSIISDYGFEGIENKSEKYEMYVRTISEAVDHITGKYDATVIFVPHVIHPRHDDRKVANDIKKHIKDISGCVLIEGDYKAEELKGIIGKCDLFIGSRMHSTIASTSMGVPTIALAYSQKMHGIIGKMLGQKKYVIDIKELDKDKLISKIDEAWSDRESIKKDLSARMEDVKNLSKQNAELVYGVMARLKKGI
ncbi:polysaccharide pyruvyl transferase family protein [Methanooceanicella nereidis]|nr:polysaccharide pyruvyl transferase family protein [Methanocella sp. CWC-04]